MTGCDGGATEQCGFQVRLRKLKLGPSRRVQTSVLSLSRRWTDMLRVAELSLRGFLPAPG